MKNQVAVPSDPGQSTSTVVLESVSKVFRHRPALFNWIGQESTGETRALDRVSLVAAARQVTVLLGPNGSGKTTVLKLIATMLLPDAGRVLVEGADTSCDAQRVRRNVGFAVAAERSFFPRLTARENLDVFAALEDVARRARPERIDEVLEATDLTGAADKLVMKFSSGMYHRLGIARALLKRPSVLLLDEPTRSLDPAAADRLWHLLRQTAARRSCIVMATHSFDEAVSVGHSVAVLNGGRLVSCCPIPAGTSSDDLRAFYFHETESLPNTSHFQSRGAL